MKLINMRENKTYYAKSSEASGELYLEEGDKVVFLDIVMSLMGLPEGAFIGKHIDSNGIEMYGIMFAKDFTKKKPKGTK